MKYPILVLVSLGLIAAVTSLWDRNQSSNIPRPLQAFESASGLLPARSPISPSGQIPQPAVPPGSEDNSRKKFSDMGVLERNTIRDEIAKQGASVVFRAMLAAERVEHDSLKQMQLQSTLAKTLRENPRAEFVGEAREFLENKSNPKFERDLLLGAIGSASTVETVSLLIHLASTSADTELKDSASAALSHVERGSDTVSPALEHLWIESNDATLLNSVAISMARIGAPTSIDLLLSAALSMRTLNNDVRRNIAQRALESGLILNPAAVPILASHLANYPPATPAAALVSSALAGVGDGSSSAALLNWFQSIDDSGAPLAHDYVMRTRAPAQLAAWESALSAPTPFRSEKVREAIRTGLSDFHESRK